MKSVLIVDDSQSVREQLVNVLEDAGYAVTEAVDGIDGCEKLRDCDDYALIICDVNMPGMDGLAMVEQVTTQPHPITAPILMLTTEGQPEMIRRAKKAGAKGWMVKPFKADLLLQTVERLTSSDSGAVS
jgi:two-component system, chemotaxis family, chemotaxis protein CheY